MTMPDEGRRRAAQTSTRRDEALTGLYSHFLLQTTSSWDVPSGPAGLYCVTQGVYVATGLATIPLHRVAGAVPSPIEFDLDGLRALPLRTATQGRSR